MKKAFLLLILMALTGSAFAMTRDDRSIPVSAVAAVGGQSIQSTKVNLGASGTTTQLSSTSIPCITATVCAAANSTGDIVYVGGSNTVVGNPKIYHNSASVDVGIPVGTGTSVDRCATFAVDNVNKLYASPRATNDVVTVTYTDFV